MGREKLTDVQICVNSGLRLVGPNRGRCECGTEFSLRDDKGVLSYSHRAHLKHWCRLLQQPQQQQQPNLPASRGNQFMALCDQIQETVHEMKALHSSDKGAVEELDLLCHPSQSHPPRIRRHRATTASTGRRINPKQKQPLLSLTGKKEKAVIFNNVLLTCMKVVGFALIVLLWKIFSVYLKYENISRNYPRLTDVSTRTNYHSYSLPTVAPPTYRTANRYDTNQLASEAGSEIVSEAGSGIGFEAEAGSGAGFEAEAGSGAVFEAEAGSGAGFEAEAGSEAGFEAMSKAFPKGSVVAAGLVAAGLVAAVCLFMYRRRVRQEGLIDAMFPLFIPEDSASAPTPVPHHPQPLIQQDVPILENEVINHQQVDKLSSEVDREILNLQNYFEQ